MTNVEEFLRVQNIEFVLHEHPAVFTCAQAETYCADIPGLACKNLFLQNDKKTTYILFVLPAHKKANLKKLSEQLGEKKLRFASEEDVQKILALEPGSLTPFGLLNDEEQCVILCLDTEVLHAEIVTFHPNRNTATLELTQDMFQKYLHCINKTCIEVF